MSVASGKPILRQEAVARVLALRPEDRASQQAALDRAFDALPGLADAGTLLLYVSTFPEEVETRPWLARSLATGRRLICPRVDRRRKRLRLFAIADLDTDLVRGAMGIPEPGPRCVEVPPTAVDWVLVPGLAFDRRGYRLGRGGGYYDRLLPTLRPEAPRWALCLDCQWVDELPVEPHDVPVDGVVSPSRRFSRS